MSASSQPVLSLNNVTKRYHQTLAVNDVSLSLYPGDVCGFLGPNGAGKTTTLRMILGLVQPTQGSVAIHGIDVHTSPTQALQGVGAIIEESHFYPYLTGEQNLLQVLRLRGLKVAPADLRERLHAVGLGEAARRRVRGYSLGMRQRLALALALIQAPQLLILDEPMNGLDPAAMQEFRTHLADMAQTGVTILLSSHILSEVEQLATRLVFMKEGRIVGRDDLLRTPQLQVRVTDREQLQRWLSERHHEFTQGPDDAFTVAMVNEMDCPGLVREWVQAGFDILEVRPTAQSLESQYLARMTEPGEDVNDV